MTSVDRLAEATLMAALPHPQLFAQIVADPSYQALIGSGLLLTLGLTLRYVHALSDLHRGHAPDFLTPVLRLTVLMALLANYRSICVAMVTFVADVGQQSFENANMEALWEARRSAYAQHWTQAADVSTSSVQSREGYVMAGIERAAHLGLLSSQASLLGLRLAQLAALVVLFLAGPWLLALAFVGGPFAGLGWSWLLALIEVASWSWALRAMAYVLAHAAPLPTAHDYTFSHEFVVSTITTLLPLFVPPLMARLWRGWVAAEAHKGWAAWRGRASIGSTHATAPAVVVSPRMSQEGGQW